MTKLQLQGIIPPIITPFNEDRTVDEVAISELAAYMIASGVHGIFALGTAGEAPMLTRGQRAQALSALSKVCKDKVPLLVGVLEASTDRAIEAVKDAELYGADAIVASAPYYYKLQQEEIYRHFAAIREATELPIILYNIPAYLGTGNLIEPETIVRIAKLPGVIGYKDSSGLIAKFQKTLALTKDLEHFNVLQGAHTLSVISLLMGAKGIVPGIGNVIPDVIVSLYDAVQEGRLEEAYELQNIIIDLDDALPLGGYSLATIKAMVQMIGYGNGIPHQPWPSLTAEQASRVAAVLHAQKSKFSAIQ